MKRIFLTTLSLALAAMISHPAHADEAEAKRENAVKENMAMARMLENIAAPILIKNAQTCGGEVAPYLGAHFVTVDSVSESYQNVMAKLYSAGNYPTVTIIGQGSPAAQSLKLADMVVEINGQPLTPGVTSLDEMRAAIAGNAGTSLAMKIDRAGQVQTVNVKPVMACDYKVLLSNDTDVDIFTDGQKIMVTKGMVETADANALSEAIEEELIDSGE